MVHYDSIGGYIRFLYCINEQKKKGSDKSAHKCSVFRPITSLIYKMGLIARKPFFRGFANNTGADQPAHPRSLISVFVILFLDNFICKLATDEISFF